MDYIVLDMEWNQPWPGSPSAKKVLPVQIRGEIIQIGAVRLSDQQVKDEFQVLVYPKYYRRLNRRVSKLTGIKENHWRKTPTPDLEWLAEFAAVDGYKILLSHHPEYYEEYIRDLNVDLTLSGHAHGGQWRIFGRGLFAPGQGILPKYDSGLYEKNGTTMIVSRGLGNSTFPLRFNNCPEIIIITLKEAKQ